MMEKGTKNIDAIIKTVTVSLLVMLLLSGCFGHIDREELKLGEKAEKDAVLLIQEHFRNKYAMDVAIYSVNADYSGCAHDSDRSFTGLVDAIVTCNDEKYSVQVRNQMVYDKYQAEEIKQACFNYVLEKLNLPQPDIYEISPNTLFVNEYFDGTNTEAIFNMISPDFLLIYDGDIDLDSDFYEKLTALYENTKYSRQSMELIVLKKGSADKISLKGWYENSAFHYAPYVKYTINYKKSDNTEPEMHQYLVEPFSNDLPFFKEFLTMKHGYGSGNLAIRQEEPSQGWDIEENFEQITPSIHFLWNENRWDFYHIFMPSSVWKDFFEKYDEIYMMEYQMTENGEIRYVKELIKSEEKESSKMSMNGDFFRFSISDSTDYITFFGAIK